MLCALRASFPRAFIAWLVQEAAAPLLESHDDLDQLIVVKRNWIRSLSGIRRLREQLRFLKFDIAIDPQSLTKSSAACWLSGAKRRIGLARPAGREVAPWLNNELVVPETRVVDRYLGLLRRLGVERPKVDFKVPRDRNAERIIEEFLSASRLRNGFAVLNAGAGWPSRQWPTDRFAKTAQHLLDQHGIGSLAIWQGPRELELAQRIVRLSNGSALLAPPTNLSELAGLLRRAILFIGSDSGPLHLAGAVGTPCVGLYGPTRHQETAPHGQQHVVVQQYFQAGSRRQRRRGDNHAMRAIPVELVYAGCDQILRNLAKSDSPTHVSTAGDNPLASDRAQFQGAPALVDEMRHEFV